MKNAFYFTLKALFAHKRFKFLSWLSGQVQERLDRKMKMISKFMASQPEKQRTAIHILVNISRWKDDEAIKFG